MANGAVDGIEFSSDAIDLAAQWMGEPGAAEAEGAPAPAAAAGEGRRRRGLGAKVRKVSRGESAIGKLIRRSLEADDGDSGPEDSLEMHGVEDDVGDESRAAAVGGRRKKGPAPRPGGVPGLSPRKGKKRPSDSAAAAAAVEPLVQTSSELADGAAPERRRKRTKTRSKQKNIRRDNRSKEQRPAHLRPGSAFTGRALTEATRARLSYSGGHNRVALEADAARLDAVAAEAGVSVAATEAPRATAAKALSKSQKRKLKAKQRKLEAAAASAP